ncbi:MAG TPA: phosphoglycerate mutase, partial [bacterium]|nr:phosphoglycerate mutase [bacterium]
NAEFTAGILNKFLQSAQKILAEQNTKAKTILLRGFSMLPDIEPFEKRYCLKSVCIASYPMYKGLAKLVGMDVMNNLETIDDQINILPDVYNNYDFFYLHYKKTDSAGEDGNFMKKVAAIEEFDAKIAQIKNLRFDALCLTGDHSTPSVLKGHSWHPVPLVIVSPTVLPDQVDIFTERACAKGMLGTIRASSIMFWLLACCLKLEKFGA